MSSDVPEPPWWTVRARGEPRSSLSRDAIVAAAIEVLHQEGLERLSMRRVADRLDAGVATLYWHVADKEQLIHLVLDHVIGEIELPEPDPERWEEQLRDYAHSARAMFRRHRGVASASLGRVPMGPNLARVGEWVLALLTRAGVPTRAAAWMADLLALVGTAQAAEEDVVASQGKEAFAGIADYIAMLPPEQFPNLVAGLEEMAGGSPDERLEFALDVLTRGVGTFIDRAE